MRTLRLGHSSSDSRTATSAGSSSRSRTRRVPRPANGGSKSPSRNCTTGRCRGRGRSMDGVPCPGHGHSPPRASSGRVVRHHLQAERLIGPFPDTSEGRGGTDASDAAGLRAGRPHEAVRRVEGDATMPMPHRTFAQVAKRRLTGKEGRERVREVNALLAELPDYRNGPYADLRKWLQAEIEDTRVRANAVHRDSIAVRREGAAQIALVGPPNVGKSSLLQALSEIQIKTGDYPFTTLRPVPALTRIGGVLVQLVEIPGLIGGATDDRGGGRALLGVLRTADAIVYCCRASADTTELAAVIAEVQMAGIEKPAVLAVTRADEADREATEAIRRAFPTLPVVTVSILDEQSLEAF